MAGLTQHKGRLSTVANQVAEDKKSARDTAGRINKRIQMIIKLWWSQNQCRHQDIAAVKSSAQWWQFPATLRQLIDAKRRPPRSYEGGIRADAEQTWQGCRPRRAR